MWVKDKDKWYDPTIKSSETATGAVRYDVAQSLSGGEKTQAKTNIGLATVATTGAYSDLTGVPAATGAVRYDVAQFFGDDAQAQARANIGMGTAASYDAPASGDALSSQVMLGNDSHNFNARAPTAHTQALSTLTQSSAITGQVATWNGTAWVPATPSGGGGMAIGSAITGATANKALYADASNNLAQANITCGRSDADMYVPILANKASALMGGMTVQSFSTSDAFVAANVIYNGGSGGFIRVAYGSGSIVRLSGNEVYVSHFGNDTGGSVASPVTSARFDSAGLEIYGRVIAQKIRTTSYTLAALNSAIPSPTVGDRSFITDETTGAFRVACVGGGAISTPVYYDGLWRNG